MKRLTSYIFITFLFIGCEVISEDKSDDLIARAGGNFLYQNELPSFSSLEDSLLRYTNYIESWAKEKILYDLSLTNLSQTKKNDLDLLVEKYKVDLYINSYKDLLVNSRIDSIISYEEIDSFYSKNVNNFKLKENLIKYRYLKAILTTSLRLDVIRRRPASLSWSSWYRMASFFSSSGERRG